MTLRVILPIHRGRISPLLDTAQRALMVETRDGGEPLRSEIDLPGDGGAAQIESLIASGAQRVVCGAVSKGLMDEILWRGLQVWPGVAGEVEEVIASLASRGMPDEFLMMPGFRGGGRGRGGGCGRGRRRQRWGWRSAGGDMGAESPGEWRARHQKMKEGGQGNARR